jgi:hypothetical protein
MPLSHFQLAGNRINTDNNNNGKNGHPYLIRMHCNKRGMAM